MGCLFENLTLYRTPGEVIKGMRLENATLPIINTLEAVNTYGPYQAFGYTTGNQKLIM